MLMYAILAQFMHKPPVTTKSFSPESNGISFFTLPQEEYTSQSRTTEEQAQGSRPGFAVGSEGGFFFSGTGDQQRDRIATGVCKVTNARGYLRFPASE